MFIKDRWFYLLSFFDLPSGSIMGLFTFMVISLSCFCIVSGRPFPATIASIYSVAVSGYVVHRTFGGSIQGQSDVTVTTQINNPSSSQVKQGE